MNHITNYFSIIVLSLFIGTNTFAQDIIRTKVGKDISAKVLEVSDEEVSYKMFDNQEGPTFKISTEKLTKILFENGSEYAFVEEKTNHSLPADAPLRDLVASGNNVYVSMTDQSGTFDEKDEFIKGYIKDYTYWVIVDTVEEADFILSIDAYSKKTWRTAPADTYFMTASICRLDGTVLWTGDEEWGAANIYSGMNPVRDVSKKVLKSLAKDLKLPNK